MGDRCNIIVTSHPIPQGATLGDILKEGVVVFYGHWCGEEMPVRLRDALAKHWRWDDHPYLARIIFDSFCPNGGDETGYGISTGICDNEHPIFVVDVPKQQVRMFAGASGEGSWVSMRWWPFADFILMNDAALTDAYEGAN